MTYGEARPESRAVRFVESLKLQMEQMMRVGDVLDCSRNHRGQPRQEHRAEIEEETQIAIGLLREGKSATQAGQYIGISGVALQQRLFTRGTNITKIRNGETI